MIRLDYIKRAAAVCGLGIICLGAPACNRLFQKEKKIELSAAEKKAAAGEYRAAISLYEAALEGTEASAEVHYRLAVIYDDKLKDPVSALHHFHRYAELAPNGPHIKEAKAYKKEGHVKLLATLSNGNMVSQEEAVRIKNENLSLRKTIVEMRAQKPVTIPGKSTGTTVKGEPVRKPIPPGAKTHVVQPGETLASIATKYYKNKARWKDIQDANFFSLDGTAKIKPGQELIIP